MDDCWLSNPSIVTTSGVLLAVSTFLTAGHLVLPTKVFYALHDDVVTVIFILVIFYFTSISTVPSILIAMTLLLLYIGIHSVKSSESFCPSQVVTNLYPEDESGGRCNYSLHPDLHKNESPPTVATPEPEWVQELAQETEQAPKDFSFEAYEEAEDGADFNASFQ